MTPAKREALYRWRKKNPERWAEINRRSRAKNRAKRHAAIAEWKAQHPLLVRAYGRVWYWRNREVICARRRARREARRAGGEA